MTGTSIKSILAIALLVGVASQANADIWNHVGQQAVDIQRATKTLRAQVDHYRGGPGYGQLLGYTARLKAHATAVRNISLHSHSTSALRVEVRLLEQVFHETENTFDQAERDAAYGRGRVRGNTAHVKQLLIGIGDCIAYLRNDIEQLARLETRSYRKPYTAPQTVRRPVYNIPSRSVYGSPYGNRSYKVKGNGYGYGKSHSRGYDRGYSGKPNGGSNFGISIGGGSSRISFRF